ncbi:putative ephrin-A4, partial [Triplophysa rosa]
LNNCLTSTGFILDKATKDFYSVVVYTAGIQMLTGDDYSVQVNLSDYLDILCPHYPASHPLTGPVETLALYLVAEGQFRGCVETKEAIKRWECNQPYAPYGPVRFSEKIQRFTPFSLGFEFLPGHHYYYSSLSTDDGPPLPCMKLRVTVCCPPIMLTFRSAWLMQDQQGMPPCKSGNGSPVRKPSDPIPPHASHMYIHAHQLRSCLTQYPAGALAPNLPLGLS